MTNNQHPDYSGIESFPETEFDRHRAARLLQAARMASRHDPTDESVDWAFSSLPDSIPARRLKIIALLDSRDAHAADALIARGRLDHPNCPSLGFLWCQSLVQQQRWDEAARIMNGVLQQRPTHGQTLQLAAEIALHRDQKNSAVTWLTRAVACHPRRHLLCHQLIEALLKAGDSKQAETELARIDNPPPLLVARVLRARNRWCDARIVLERAVEQASSDHDECAAELIDLLEETGAYSALGEFLDPLPSDSPVVMLRAGKASLSLGWFNRAVEFALPFADHTAHQGIALRILVVAGALSEDHDLAYGALTELRLTENKNDHRVMAEYWRRGLFGRIMKNAGKKHGSNPVHLPEILPGLIQRARRVLADAENTSMRT